MNLNSQLLDEIIDRCENVKPIKFDDDKCFVYYHLYRTGSTSIRIYSFKDSSLLQEISIFVPFVKNIYKKMVIDSNYNLIYANDLNRTISCFNLLTKQHFSTPTANLKFTRLMLTQDEHLFLINSENIFSIKII